MDTAAKMEGVVRNAGTHAAGVVISDEPLINYLPLHRPTNNSEETPIKTVTQFEMGILEKLKLLKVDFLGLATLTTMARACDNIRQRHAVTYTLENIPTDDPETFRFLGEGNTMGVFQLEGSGMTRWLVQMKPTTLEHVIAMVALFRPGPMDFIPDYISRMHGESPVEYRHPSLEPIFSSTYGIPLYQEQLMRAAVDLAGYTPGEADDLRKAISKKKKEDIEKHRRKFVSGAIKNGIPSDTAEAIYSDWEEFARYGFNKCLPGYVEIADSATGRLVKIKDLFDKTASLDQAISCNTETLKLHKSRISRVVDNGLKPVYRLTTSLGRTIDATANHPFYTSEGWKILDHLQKGDFIAVPRQLPIEGTQEWPEHEVIALGQLLAEGNLCHPHSVYYYSQDRVQVDDFVRAAESFDNISCTISMHRNTYSVYAGRTDRQALPGIFIWAGKLGILGKNAREKEIPSEAFELTNRQISLLISRMWEGDGHLDRPTHSAFYATASERMARQLQHLLLRLGIISRLRKVRFPYKEGRIGWQLYVTGHENLATFAKKIGAHFISPQRKDILRVLIAEMSHDARSTKDVVPIGVKEIVRKAKSDTKVTWQEMNVTSGIAVREFYPTHTSTKRGFSRQTISRLANYFENSDLQRLAESDIYWDEIASIEYVGKEKTYDLEVPGDHNFVANDILVHNSHAADYGVLAVQTAFLKLHYPVEYMTALLSVTKSETEKMALYVNDTRTMGVEVLPPDVNASAWDFAIEDKDGKSAIRFGLGAIKNVGQGAVELITAARGGKPFQDLNELARRVDLRAVGRRALESLIKVGALDQFGSRAAMLEVLERIVAASASHFRAELAGQMSLFGAHTGVSESIALPLVPDADRRETLNWERELIGMYVSEHPLTPYAETIRKVVSYFSTNLGEAAHQEPVKVAGMVAGIRPHQTKTGKMMAWVNLEDLTGTIELVLFPRTWEKFQFLLEVGGVILVEGKVDAQSSPSKVLVDNIKTEITIVTAAEPGAAPTAAERKQAQIQKPFTGKTRVMIAEPVPAYKDLSRPAMDDDEPPMPEDPPEWETYFPADRKTAPIPEPALEAANLTEADAPAGRASAPTGVSGAALSEVPPAVEPLAAVLPAVKIPASIVPPAPKLAAARPSSLDEEHAPQMVTVVLRPCGDPERDIRRIGRLHGTFISYPGKDRFQFQIFEDGRGHLIDFPNDTTRFCTELLEKLQGVVGEENVHIEPILYQ
jgi:DNA polymerase-3 subunit alpha